MRDLIDRQKAIEALQKEIDKGKPPFNDTIGAIRCGVRLARNIIEDLPSAQPVVKDINVPVSDCISRQAAINALGDKPLAWTEGEYELGLQNQWQSDVDALKELPSVQPERLTDDDFETIRIHLNAIKEKLCNQHRWKEAEEYQRIIDRFMAFAQSDTCKGCKHMGKWDNEVQYGYPSPCTGCKRGASDNYEPSTQPENMCVNLDIQKITKHKSDFSDLDCYER